MTSLMALAAVPAAFLSMAQSAPVVSGQQVSPVQDDYNNHVVCERQTLVGSRLAVRKVCKTRGDWMRDRLADRQEIDRVQTLRSNEVSKAQRDMEARPH